MTDEPRSAAPSDPHRLQSPIQSELRIRHAAILVLSWGGAVLFVASLLWFLYCYLVRFGRPAPTGSVTLTVSLNILMFSAFALHHSLLARSGIKRRVRSLVPPELERSLYTWVASVLFLGVCGWWQPVPGVIYELDGFSRLVAYGIQLIGLVLTIRASSVLDVLDLAGVRPVLLAIRGAAPRHVTLETRGVYGFVRHPLYLGWVLFVFGTPVMTATRATFAVVSTMYLVIAVPWEERSLVEVFGSDYEAYQKKIRWRIVPGIY
jgi:methanethiol S-methyltransferase